MEIYHYGVKGMKWGVRRADKETPKSNTKRNELDDIKVYTKKGVQVSLSRGPTPLITRMLSKISPKMRENVNNSDIMNLEVNGKHVGDLQLYRESRKSINVVWVSVESKYEGNGYGSAAMRAVIDYAKKTGCEQVTLEVPGISPNARHIYESLGFKAGNKISDDDDMWGGLTEMKLDLNK